MIVPTREKRSSPKKSTLQKMIVPKRKTRSLKKSIQQKTRRKRLKINLASRRKIQRNPEKIRNLITVTGQMKATVGPIL